MKLANLSKRYMDTRDSFASQIICVSQKPCLLPLKMNVGAPYLSKALNKGQISQKKNVV